MMALSRRQNLAVWATALALALLPLLATLTGNGYLLNLASRILIYALAAVSLDLLLGYGKLISLGHAAFVGIGAYAAGILSQHAMDKTPLLSWPLMVAGSDNGLILLPLSILAAAAAALVIGALSLRTTGMHFIMITLAFAQMLFYFFVSLEKYGGDDGLSLTSRMRLPGLDLARDTHFYWLCLGLLALFLLLARRLVSSRFGLVLRGAGGNERRARAFGINTFRHRLTAFVIAGGGAGLAGALMANQSEFVSPGLLHWTMSGELMVMVLLGGLGTLFGPVLGAGAFLLLEELLSMYTEHWMVYMGPLLILTVLFAKQGIFGLLAGRRKP